MANKITSGILAVIILSMVVYSVFNSKSESLSASSAPQQTEKSKENEGSVTKEKDENEITNNGTVVVEIKGAVVNPGVYSFSSNERVVDLIEMAGGLLENANIDYINQSRVLIDQMLVIILTNDEIAQAISLKELVAPVESCVSEVNEISEVNGYDECYCDGEETKPADVGSGKTNTSEKVSINNASVESLMTLSGIGEAKAKDIVSYRESNGGFKSLEELMNVSGIGEATFNKIKNNITL